MITINHITHRYFQGTDEREVLKGIDLTIQQGEWLSITGKNGSGKSTLIRMLNGLSIPNTGTVFVEGLNSENTKNRQIIKQKVQLVFQNPDAQIIGNTPIEDIAFGLENRGIPKEQMKSRITAVLEQVRLDHKGNDLVSSLSGGEKQRLAIASCLALEPEYIIFDESTSMLDPLGKKEIMNIALSLWKQGMTVIWVTQELEELLRSSRIIVIDHGIITYDGEPRELFYVTDIPKQQRWNLPPIIQIGSLLKSQGLHLETLPLCEEDLEDLLCKFNFQM